MKIRSFILALTVLFIAPVVYAQSADVVTVVDESGSMATEHEWLPDMIAALDGGLQTAGIGTAPSDLNQYGIVGFGHLDHTAATYQGPHDHLVDGNQWFSAADYDLATPPLNPYGGYEDGYEAIDFAFNSRTYRAGSATNIILVTDEDRDDPVSWGLSSTDPYSYDGTLQLLIDNNALLNVVVNAGFLCGDGSTVALGIDASGTGYVADGSGGYTTCEGAYAYYGYGSTIDDYVALALASGGAAWDLNQLRDGSLPGNEDLANSFTKAFVEIKVQEIEEQEVPEPGTLALLGLGLLGLGVARRRSIAQ